jgi:hypothetical protein
VRVKLPYVLCPSRWAAGQVGGRGAANQLFYI